MRLTRLIAWLLIVCLLVSCASITKPISSRSPAVERKDITNKNVVVESNATKTKRRNAEWRPEVHVVQKGETLYSIAFNYGFAYRDLAELNGIKNPSAISIGQTIRLFPKISTAIAPGSIVESKPTAPLLKEQPKLVKYPYSDAAMALIDKVQQINHSEGIPQVSPEPAIVGSNVSAAKVEIKDAEPSKSDDNTEDEKDEPAIDWGMPTQGKLISHYSESANRKGIDIAGKLGQPILASASGKVVYSGSGLRGYGKLIIIKHNATYLSAYAHNDKILVKEGQSVTRGEKIAAMGSTDTDRVKLHFEVRRLGKPVDPAKFLPLGKS